MKAAVVTDFGQAPAYGDFREPVAGEGETIVRVCAAPFSPIPDDISDVRAAAVAAGGPASWAVLTRRAPIQPGSTVLVNGATGAAGGMAVQIARHFGARRIIASVAAASGWTGSK
ncbi:hypothetical protein NKZ04_21820 [Sinorhizobium meliloti]|uniref:hypothetical protein n=1 Tax=Rhizobium meliloti TaxID=382 RepID=UPI003D6583B9